MKLALWNRSSSASFRANFGRGQVNGTVDVSKSG
jgi:hypothetical protein